MRMEILERTLREKSNQSEGEREKLCEVKRRV